MTSEVNVDANLVKSENTLSRTEEKLVEMSNGCICCTLREDLMIEVERLTNENRFDYLLIESTGIMNLYQLPKHSHLLVKKMGLIYQDLAM